MNQTILGKYLITSALEKPHKGWGIRIEGNRIRDVGPNDALRAKYGIEEILDASDKIIMPGFVNSHMHMFSSLANGMPRPKIWGEVIDFLQQYYWPNIEDKADHEALRASTASSAALMLQSGVTTVCDVMEAPFALPGCLDVAAQVIDQCGMRAVLTFEATERVSAENGQSGLEENRQFIQNNPRGKGRISGMMCVHTTFTCSFPFFKQARKMADQLGSGLRMHVSESRYEMLHCLSTYGMLPFEVYESIGFLGPDTLGSLAVHVQPKELVIAAKRDMKIAHLPHASANPGVGVAPVPAYLAHGMTVGIATYPQYNPFATMRSAQLLHRAHWLDGTLLPGWQVLDMMTHSAAKTLGLDDVGDLAIGKLADLLIIDGDFYVPVNENNLIDMIIIYRDPSSIRHAIIDGEFVIRNGNLLTLDLAKVSEDINKASRDLWVRNGFTPE